MGASTMGSRTPPGGATDEVTAADEDAFVENAKGSRRNGRTRTRPVVDARAAAGTAASVADATDGRRATGVRLPWGLPKTLARSQVEKGAVKGTKTSTTSQEAKSLGSIALSKVPPGL
jgi:hypothetical protein